MKTKIRKILLSTLKSVYDGGNIDDGSITGGNNAVDQLYDLFVDEGTFVVRHPENSEIPFSEKKTEKPKKVGEILYTNPKTGKTQKLFDELLPVYTVRYENPDRGGVIYITLCAKDKTEAINNAMHNKEFYDYIPLQYFKREYFNVYKALGNYVIGKVTCTDSEPKL
jgi:hypothetical protein